MAKRRLKPKILGISIKTWARYLCYIGLAVVFLILSILLTIKKNSLVDQSEAKRWSSDGDAAQVTAFFTNDSMAVGDQVLEWRFNIDKALEEKSMEATVSGTRLYADSYASSGTVTMVSDYGSVTVDAMGVGGDFFMFHPVSLLYGGYFQESDLMQDAVVLDRETAWQLYGSSDIVGKTVRIGDVEHRIVGVYQHRKGKLYEKADGDTPLCYISYDSMRKYGSNETLLFYELVLPNIVKGFALQILKDSCTIDEKKMELIDNSDRFSYEHLLDVLKSRDERMMKKQPVIYPSWENVARIVEWKASLIALGQVIVLLILIILLTTEAILFIRRNKLTKKRMEKLMDQINQFLRKYRKKRGEKNEEI